MILETEIGEVWGRGEMMMVVMMRRTIMMMRVTMYYSGVSIRLIAEEDSAYFVTGIKTEVQIGLFTHLFPKLHKTPAPIRSK